MVKENYSYPLLPDWSIYQSVKKVKENEKKFVKG